MESRLSGFSPWRITIIFFAMASSRNSTLRLFTKKENHSKNLVCLTVLGAADFLNPFEECAGPFFKRRAFRIRGAALAQSAQLFLIHDLKSRRPEDGLDGLRIQTRKPINQQSLFLFKDVLGASECCPELARCRVEENGLRLPIVETFARIGAQEVEGAFRL